MKTSATARTPDAPAGRSLSQAAELELIGEPLGNEPVQLGRDGVVWSGGLPLTEDAVSGMSVRRATSAVSR